MGIFNYFHFPISSGKLEGINNKIVCLKRTAYGFRDDAFRHSLGHGEQIRLLWDGQLGQSIEPSGALLQVTGIEQGIERARVNSCRKRIAVRKVPHVL